jgi:LmbE family N-acetylglucosaminyl deacetylase
VPEAKVYRDVVIERPAAGSPRASQVLGVVEAHADDSEWGFAKFIAEGGTACLIRTTNDECTGTGTVGEGFPNNERDNTRIARTLGIRRAFDLNYRNHRLDGVSRLDLRARLIFLSCLMKVDVVQTWDPAAHYEENPDHSVTALAVEAACWMAGGDKDYPEHFARGLEPHAVRERYYYARPDSPQIVNRVVDITPWAEKKLDAMVASQQQLGGRGARLRAALAAKGLKLPVPGDTDEWADRAHVRLAYLTIDQEIGRRFGLAYAEQVPLRRPPGGRQAAGGICRAQFRAALRSTHATTPLHRNPGRAGCPIGIRQRSHHRAARSEQTARRQGAGLRPAALRRHPIRRRPGCQTAS